MKTHLLFLLLAAACLGQTLPVNVQKAPSTNEITGNLTIPSGRTLTVNSAVVFGDGVTQTFNPDTTNAGFNVGSVATDPATPNDGDAWYQTGNETFNFRINATTVSIGTTTGSGALVFGTSPTIATPTISGAIVFPDGVLQTFNPDGTNAGLNVGAYTADPSSLVDGDLWYNSTDDELKARINGASVALGAGGGGSVATDAIWTAKGQIAGATGSAAAVAVNVGTDGYVLTADSAETAGFKWAPGGGGSGGTLTLARFSALSNQPPASAFATFNTRNAIAVLDYDSGTDESAVFLSTIPEAADFTTGLTAILKWAAASATSGDCVWVVAFERLNTDMDSDSFATGVSGTTTTNGTSGVPNTTSINFTGSEIDGIVAGDLFRVKVTRDADAGGDTMTGDSQLIAVEIRQQ